MGFSLTWCAVPDKHAAAFLRGLALVPTGEIEDTIPSSLIATARLDTGWQLLVYNKYRCPFLEEADLRRLSADYYVIFCLVEEHMMASASEMWSRGERRWRLSHEGEDGPKGLDIDEDPPYLYTTIRAEMEHAQASAGGDDANVDYIFEIPLRTAQSLVGFKHDEICRHVIGQKYTVLSRTV
jgi:hypothetical protein